MDSAGLADSPSTSILLWAACGVSTSMAEAIARATAERSSLSGGAGLFCRAAPVRAEGWGTRPLLAPAWCFQRTR